MLTLIDIILLGCCLAIIYQDFKLRSIHWFWLPIILMALVAKQLLNGDYAFFTNDFPLNLALLIVNGLAVSIYFSLKQKKWINLVDRMIGKGDILLYLTMAMAFSFPDFVLFFIASLLLPLLIFGIQFIFKVGTQQSIPLAAYICIVFLAIQLMHYLPFHLTDSIFYSWTTT